MLYDKDRDVAIEEIKALHKSNKTYKAEKLSIIMSFYGITQNDIEEVRVNAKNHKFKRFNGNFRHKPAATFRVKTQRAKGSESRTW
jgi:hypothetical protein|tara:strand:+ start:495 stop:752 length:258 start_codon:yes stop_codon:yes gene_type:complete